MFLRKTFRILPASGLLLLVPAIAAAHEGHGGGGGNLMAGLLHPLTGLDHVLMIVAVSAWSASMPPRARLLTAACLALFVAVGALLPVAGGPALEVAIALTVVGAGALLAIGQRWPVWATALVTAGFALIHGFAHGNEGPGRSAAYIAGLAVATGLLAFCVSFIAAHLQKKPLVLRAAGLASAAAGGVALAG